jgi:hypothetical protein
VKEEDVAASRQASSSGSGNRFGRILLLVQVVLVAIAGPVYVGMSGGSKVQLLWSVPIGVGVVLAMHVLFRLIDKSVRRAEGKERSDP